MKGTFLKWVLMWCAAGFGVCLLLLLVERVVDGSQSLVTTWSYPVNRVMRVLWPSSTWLMATEGIEGTVRGNVIVFVSAIANAVLYACIGAVLWGAKLFFASTNTKA